MSIRLFVSCLAAGSMSAACALTPVAEVGAGDGAVPCAVWESACGDRCVDLGSDPDNCGACNNVCGRGNDCVAGRCQLSCNGGTLRCGLACVDPRWDPANCGGCGNGCPAGDTCEDGDCVGGGACLPPTTRCGGHCVNTTSNASNCGSCGAACEPGQPCTNGVCNGTADAGTNLDGGADAGWAPKGGYPDGSVAPTSSSVNVLSYNVVDAKFSNALGAIVAVSNTPNNALHIYTPSTQADEAVPLPIAPVAVALDPTGLFAAVAFDAHVAEIDLSATTIRTTCPLSSDAFDIVLAAGRKTYVVPATDQWVSLHAIDLATCTETTSGGYSIYAAEYMALHPSGAYVFAAEQDLEPSRINKCDVSSPTITCTDSEGMNDWGTYGFYGRVWTSSDGLRLYSGSGATLLVPGDPSSTLCSYGGTLAGASSGVTFLSEAPVAQKIAWIPLASTWSYDGDPNADLVVSINETQFLGSVATYQIPPFPLPAGQSAAAHGQFVFTTPGLDALYVIVQADQTSGALHNYAVATMTP